ncbi:MAG: putative MnhB-related membrane protein [Chloroflexi bacterium]|nr:MAG: putative MnhB-related membrane protein [Chloroflexota bacterium]
MAWQLDIILFVLIIVAAIFALQIRDLLAAVIALGAYSFFAAVLLAEMGAVDVAFTEAALGAGVTTVLFVVAIFVTRRRSED